MAKRITPEEQSVLAAALTSYIAEARCWLDEYRENPTAFTLGEFQEVSDDLRRAQILLDLTNNDYIEVR